MKEKIIIAGGSGFLGQVLERYFTKKEYAVIILTRTPTKANHVQWDGHSLSGWEHNLNCAKLLINLTGKSVDCRYNEQNRKLIYSSRIDATIILAKAINCCTNPPQTWINSSTATIYEHALEKEQGEKDGFIGHDFSMNIARSWETTFYAAETPKTRKIAIRTAIVMGKHGGALPVLKKLVKLGLGGKQGTGKQKVSWIHEDDFSSAVDFLLTNTDLKGSYNLTVPKPTTNQLLMKSLRTVLKIPFGIPQPVWLLALGAKIIGTETELILKSRNVIPALLTQAGFVFKYTDITRALKQLTHDKY
jgi:hypothetical protein